MDQQQLIGIPTMQFDTRSDFHAQILLAMESAQREIWMADGDFSKWPLNRPEVENALHRFLLASRANRLHLLTYQSQHLQNATPRFMRLLRLFGHAIICRQPADTLTSRVAEAMSMVIVDRTRLVRRFHRDGMRGVATADPAEVSLWIEQLEAIWDDATPGLAATTLGLSA